MQRRGFLGIIGGCFAALATNAIPAAGAIREPRYWVSVRALPPVRHQAFPRMFLGWSAARNDGQFFSTTGSVPCVEDVEARKVIVADMSHHLRLMLNEFLDCDCTVGYFCEKHKYLDPKLCPVEDDAEEVDSAVQSI